MGTLKDLLVKLIGKVNQLSSEIAAIGTQEAIVQQVISALGTPVFGRVDEERNIILTGNLVDGTYTLKYEDAEGNVTEIVKIDFGGGIKNQIPLSINADGTPYVGDNGEAGYKTGTRLNTSGVESTSSATNFSCSGFIPAKLGDVVYVKNMIMRVNNGDDSCAMLCGYAEDFTYLIRSPINSLGSWLKNYTTTGDDNQLVSATIDTSVRTEWANVKYIRVSWRTVPGTEPILTINQPIEVGASYTNLADTTSADWKVNSRLNSSGSLVTTSVYGNGGAVTNFIPCKSGDVIRVKGLDVSHYYGNAQGETARTSAYFYADDKSTIIGKNVPADGNGWVYANDVWAYTVGTGLTAVSGSNSDIAYARLTGICYDGYTANDVIITVNQEIA